MPEHMKMPRSVSPVARAGAGDISERELSRERHNLQSTPPARLQPVHPKKQLFLTPVNKFTASRRAPSHLDKIRNCLQEYAATPVKRAKMAPKAASMEDLTPTKRMKKEISNTETKGAKLVRAPGLHGIAEDEAAARVARFMVVAAWRRRREEVRCVRKTLEFQVSCSERLRLQVCALKSLLDSDNAKVRLAMRELDRLKQLLKDKDEEKAVLEREKKALEEDVCNAEDRASEMSIGWRNCRNELEGVRAAAAVSEHALAMERAAAATARAQRDHAYERLSLLEEDMAQQEELLSAAEAECAALRREADGRRRELDDVRRQLGHERELRAACTRKCTTLGARNARASAEAGRLRDHISQLQAELACVRRELAVTRYQLEWWPAPLTRMVGAVRCWLRQPLSLPAALLWSAVPATHGCTHLAGADYQRKVNSNENVTAHGEDKTAHGEDKTASNEDNTAHGDDKIARGEDKTVHGEDATSHGEDATAHGEDAISNNENGISYNEDAFSNDEDSISYDEDAIHM